jgi:hypothetical protein
MYYKRTDVRQAITGFANAGGSGSFREGAFYNSRVKSIQRYFNEGEARRPVILNKPEELDHALALGASAFYSSSWWYQGRDFSSPVGHDLVWTARAKQGGLGFAKTATAWVLEALADAGVPEPWVKYNGALGFDLVVPLEMIPCEAWVGGVGSLANLQEELTSYVGGYLREQFPDVDVVGVSSPIEIKQGEKACIFSEFRARRGLLLAPMSLRPETGLVSVPVDPRQVEGFSVLDASPKNVRAFEWARPSKIAQGLMRHVRQWQSAHAQAIPAVA